MLQLKLLSTSLKDTHRSRLSFFKWNGRVYQNYINRWLTVIFFGVLIQFQDLAIRIGVNNESTISVRLFILIFVWGRQEKDHSNCPMYITHKSPDLWRLSTWMTFFLPPYKTWSSLEVTNCRVRMLMNGHTHLHYPTSYTQMAQPFFSQCFRAKKYF